MAKILSIQELKKTLWPEWIQETFGENLIAAFLHGDCLMEGFNPFKDFWLISFTLKDNAPEKIEPLQELIKKATKDKIQFGYFFTENFYTTAEDTFPLEFLHIANRNEVLVGNSRPLSDFLPNKKALRLEIERELRGAFVHLHSLFVYKKINRTSLDFFLEAERRLLPILYGVYYLENAVYPESREIVFEKYPFLKIKAPSLNEKVVSENAANYIVQVQKILKDIDSMEC